MKFQLCLLAVVAFSSIVLAVDESFAGRPKPNLFNDDLNVEPSSNKYALGHQVNQVVVQALDKASDIKDAAAHLLQTSKQKLRQHVPESVATLAHNAKEKTYQLGSKVHHVTGRALNKAGNLKNGAVNLLEVSKQRLGDAADPIVRPVVATAASWKRQARHVADKVMNKASDIKDGAAHLLQTSKQKLRQHVPESVATLAHNAKQKTYQLGGDVHRVAGHVVRRMLNQQKQETTTQLPAN